ncbi:hypothetical protein, conserved [Leishmania lindenbergi]|uniref:Uncharacterized protein n=1 Tax=Leishmania lindenbergi TaxID=651832 RepID=A0AAW2ZSU2_9TRYP
MPRLRPLNSLCPIALRQSNSWHSITCTRASASIREIHQSPASIPDLAAAASSDKLMHTASTGSSSDSCGKANNQPLQHPMELLSSVFQHHPSALRLHRELTIALADGDSARAADLASVLASTVQRVVAAQEAGPSDVAASPKGSENAKHVYQSDIPRAGLEDIEEAVEKTRQSLLHQATVLKGTSVVSDAVADAVPPGPTSAERPLSFWRDPEQLCVTVLESTFETEVLGGESQDTLTPAGNRAAEHEAEQVRILDAYLEKEAARWKAQKAAIAKIVLDVARALRLTPEDLQSFEGTFASASESAAAQAGERKLNVLRHSNLVIRGEMPSSASPTSSSETLTVGVAAELRALEERMSSLGQPLTPSELCMARYEIQMRKSKMRYVVGVHKELQLALDHSAALQRLLTQKRTPEVTFSTGMEVFMAEVIRALNEGADAYSASVTAAGTQLTVNDINAREAVETPVLPFTFMLKCSLWFTTAPPSSSG